MSILLILFIQFFILSLTSFGGVSASMSEMYRLFVVSLHLIDHKKFMELYALSQSAPGPNLLFVVLLGWNLNGLSGAIISLFSMMIPSTVLSIFFDKLMVKYKENSWVKLCKKIFVPITIGLFCASGVVLLKNSIHISTLLVALLTIFLLWRKILSPIWIILGGAILGFIGLV